MINIQNNEGKTRMFLRYDGLPTILNYQLKLEGEGTLRIAPGDPAYHQSGQYHVAVLPDFSFADIFRDNYYSFTM